MNGQLVFIAVVSGDRTIGGYIGDAAARTVRSMRLRGRGSRFERALCSDLC